MAWAPDYITDAQLAAYIDDQGNAATLMADRQPDLASAASAASRAIDMACSGARRRQFGSANGTRIYKTRCVGGEIVAEIDDLQTAAGLVVVADGVTLTSGQYELRDVNAAADGLAWTSIALVGVTAAKLTITAAPWGWTAVPPVVVTAAKLQGSRFFERRVAPFGIAGSPQDNSEMRLLSKVDPDVMVMLRNLRRPGAMR